MTTPAEVIRESYELANVIDPDEPLEGSYPAVGLSKLNDILSQWSSLGAYIETYIVETINVLQGVFTYNITPPVVEMLEGNLIDSQNCLSILIEADLKRQNTFNYPLSEIGQSRPQYVFIQNAQATILTNSVVFFYPVPDQNYTATIRWKKRLNQVTQSEEFTQISSAYMKAFKYQLAKDLSDYFETILSDRFMLEYDRLIVELKAANQKDMAVLNQNPFNYFGRRFAPWGGRYVG